MQDFRRLEVWEVAHGLALSVYKATTTLPVSERFGLTVQMRRSAASVAANIAEGCGRGSSADFARFLQIALGSASELEYQIQLTYDLGFLDPDTFQQLASEAARTKRMLTSLLRRVRDGSTGSRPPPDT